MFIFMGVSSLEQRSMYVDNTIEERERELYIFDTEFVFWGWYSYVILIIVS